MFSFIKIFLFLIPFTYNQNLTFFIDINNSLPSNSSIFTDLTTLFQSINLLNDYNYIEILLYIDSDQTLIFDQTAIVSHNTYIKSYFNIIANLQMTNNASFIISENKCLIFENLNIIFYYDDVNMEIDSVIRAEKSSSFYIKNCNFFFLEIRARISHFLNFKSGNFCEIDNFSVNGYNQIIYIDYFLYGSLVNLNINYSSFMNMTLLSTAFLDIQASYISFTSCSFKNLNLKEYSYLFELYSISNLVRNCNFELITGKKSILINVLGSSSTEISYNNFIEINNDDIILYLYLNKQILMKSNFFMNSLGTPIDIREFLRLSMSDLTILHCNSAAINVSRKFYSDLSINNIIILESLIVKDMIDKAFYFTPGIINIDLRNNFTIYISKSSFINSANLLSLTFLLIQAEDSIFYGANLSFTNNSKLFSLFQIKTLNSSLTNSIFNNNTFIQKSVIQDFSNYILQLNITIHWNQAFISTIDINPYEKSSFQIYQSSNISCFSNIVGLFGGCINFNPAYQGNYSVSDSNFSNCHSNYTSGAIHIFSINAPYLTCYYILTNINFNNNSASFEGGAFSLLFHESFYILIIAQCTFHNNQAQNGGALHFNLDAPININISQSTFSSNIAESGAAISIISGTLTILSSKFQDNQAIRGGVIESISYNKAFIIYSKFDNNTALKYGGALLLREYSIVILEQVEMINLVAIFGSLAHIDSDSKIIIESSKFAKSSGKSLLFISSGEFYCQNSIFIDIYSDNSVFFIDSSILDFQNVSIYTTFCTIFDLWSALLRFHNVSIDSAQCLKNYGEQGCVFSINYESNLQLEYLDIRNVHSKFKGGVFYLIDNSKMVVNNSIFMHIANEKIGSLLLTDSSYAELHNTNIYNVTQDLVYGYESSLILNGVSFTNPNDFIAKLSYMNIDSCSLLLIKDSVFHHLNTTTKGGLLYLSSEELFEMNSSIISCNFSYINGIAGGAIYIENTRLQINDSFFLNNSAIDGGSIYFKCSYNLIMSDNCYLGLFDNSFINNSASNHGGAIKWGFQKPIGFMMNYFLGNKAFNYGNDIASFPIKLAVKVYNASNTSQIYHKLEETLISTLRIQEAQSGHKLDFMMEFYLIDEENQIIKNIDRAKLYIDIITNENEKDFLLTRFNITNKENTSNLKNYISNFTDLTGQTSQNINEESWSFKYNDLTITAKPSTTAFLKANSLEIKSFRGDLFPKSYPLNNYEFNKTSTQTEYNYYIPINIIPCFSGQIYDNLTNTCYDCPRGTYSYNIFDPKCKNCLDSTICNGMNDLTLNEGYWRSSNISEKIYRCSVMLYLCEGGINSKCLTGYNGELCETCEDINGNKANKNYFGFCQECADIGTNILITIPIMIGVLIILNILTNFFLVRKNDNKVIDWALIKLLIIHYQMLILIPNVNTFFGNTPNLMMGSLTRNWFSYDCIFGMVFNFYFKLANRLLSISILLFLFFVCSNIFLLKWKLKYTNMITTILLKFKNFIIKSIRSKINYIPSALKKQSNTKKVIVKTKTLRKYEDNIIIKVITYNSLWLYLIQGSMLDLSFLGMRCIVIEGSSFNRYSLNYECWSDDHILWLIFLFIPNVIMWSGVLTWAMYKCLFIMKKIRKNSIIIASVGFKKKYRLLGDLMYLLRKSIVIITNNFSSENSETIPFTVFLLTAILLLAHFYTKPYNYKILNNMDAFSLYIVFATYYTLSYYYTSIDEKLASFFYNLLIIMHLVFLLLWIVVFFRRTLKLIVKRIITYYESYR